MAKKIVINACSECPYLSESNSATVASYICTINYLKDNLIQFIENVNEINENCILKDDK